MTGVQTCALPICTLVTTLELHLDLAATNVLTLQCPGEFRSQAAMGLGADIRPVAVAFRLDSWSIVPRE